MNVHELNPLERPEWSEFVLRHPLSSAFHTVGWLTALQRTYGYEPAALAIADSNNKLTDALVFCRVNSWITGRRIISLPFSDHCEPLVQDKNMLTCLAVAFVDIAKRSRCRHVELRPHSTIDHALPGFAGGKSFYLHTLDLRPGTADVYSRFHRDSIQRKIRRAEREKLRIEAGRGPEIIRDFFRLVLRTRRRHGLPAQPIQWFENLADCLGPSMTIRLAYQDQQPLAGILTLQHRATLMYKYGASDERFHSLGGMAVVFWHAIQDGIARGIEKMDMGRCDLDNPGLAAFKEHWGATRAELNYLTSPPFGSRGSWPAWTMRLARKTCNHVPAPLLGTLGSFLYRHAG
jgi:lipid II:glycine glycyltransferase (peptidoglycan interpeptide bridge formation enzyme)